MSHSDQPLRDSNVEFRQLVEQIREAREDFDQMFDLTGYLVCVADMDGHLQRINASFARHVDFSQAELIRTPLLDFIHPDDQKRDPKQAIALGESAVELSNYKDARSLDILAMAYASEGRFGQAVTTAQKAMSLASDANADRYVKAIEQRLELYKQGKSY